MTIYLRMGILMSPPIEVPESAREWKIKIPTRLEYSAMDSAGRPKIGAQIIERSATFQRHDKYVASDQLIPIFGYIG